MKPSFKIEVVSVNPNLSGDGYVEAVLRVRGSFWILSGSTTVTVWFNTRNRTGGVKAQSPTF